ncbi:beta-catenin-like protein 1 [Diplogelasinospora grovesii]|uniref:Beta-catenin-like protein 1 n=1 Tax=Diplogelasinospora grovesii TaxID=303347 RepID=A0AAN6S026_9PEZI|nr:beta-catenin-like protein 1 [Diplogelasinospora grovesii]
MTSIDELFKKSGLPSKRKLDPVRDPTEIYKSARLTSSSNGKSSRHARIDDGDEDDAEAGPAPPPATDDDDGDYGPTMPPGEDEEGDDEEGRFFGGGISAQEKEILDFVDGNDALSEEKIDLQWLKKTALNFERKITKNSELRARYENDPGKFIDSEADLDSSIKSLSILGEHPDLYSDFAKLGCVGSLVGLLAHENTDIAIDAIEIIGELTDEDVNATEEQFQSLVDALLEADLLGLLVSNFGRLDEGREEDRSGVYHALGILENLCSSSVGTAETIARDETLLKWLLARAQRQEKTVSQNKQYAAEILAILVQSSAANRRRLAELDAVDTLLQLVAPYRKRDPEKGGDEEEYMENLFEALTCVADEPLGKTKFVEAEGVELCLLMLRESGKLISKGPALRLLDHAAAAPGGEAVCQKVVEAGGLKTLFTSFMKKHDHQTTEHLVGIFASMLRLLPANSPERIRTLAKFVEKDYEKVDKLVKLRREYNARVAAVDDDPRLDVTGDDEDADEADARAEEWLSRRLEAGLFSLQTIDVILAWLVAEDDGAKKKIRTLMTEGSNVGIAFDPIRENVRDLMMGVQDMKSDEGRDTYDMLDALLSFLH